MAGISDRPFRSLCCEFGAAMAISEMLLANKAIWHSNKSVLKRAGCTDDTIKAVPIVGSDPDEMAAVAKFNAARGAQLIDINMGCPAKKVNKKLAGSALLQYPMLVERILSRVVNAVNVPVTLKIRTGWDKNNRNFLEIGKLAENCGIAALTIHGRTRACLFSGVAEYDSIREAKKTITIPVIANGDITSPEKAKSVLKYTQADAIMIGRAAQGNPWIFEEIAHYLQSGELPVTKSLGEKSLHIMAHLDALHALYGKHQGVRIARKHINWYLKGCSGSEKFRRLFNAIDTAKAQFTALEAFFNTLH